MNATPKASDHGFFVVTGRMHGDDEDSAFTYGPCSLVDARTSFITDQCIVNDKTDDFLSRCLLDQEHEGVYITTVAFSTTPIAIVG